MADAGKVGRNSTTKSAIALVLLVIAIIAIAAVVIYALTNKDILEDIVNILVMAAIVIVAVIIIAYVIIAILAVPYYAVKGESYQTDASYDLDDVESVKEKDSEEKKE